MAPFLFSLHCLLRFSTGVILLVSLSVPAICQCDTNQLLATNSYLLPVGTSDTVRNISVFFQLESPADSGHTIYTITEFKRNGDRLHLHGWCMERTIKNLNAGALSDSTRTSAFEVATGDTLTFYRELNWYNPVTLQKLPNGYYHPDSLDWAVELVDATTGNRLALLDSLGVLRSIPSGPANLHGTRPILARVAYVVPSPLNGDSVFIRVRHYTRGTGDYFTMRYDDLAANLSYRLTDSEWLEFVDTYGGGLGKMVNMDFNALAGKNFSSAHLEITPNPSSGEITITFGSIEPVKPIWIGVYDVTGRLLFMPLLSSGLTGGNTVSYTFETAGTYYVALYNGGKLDAVQRVTVTK